MSDENKPLSRRELLAVQGIAAGKTATRALLDAGYSKSVAETQQKAVLEKPRVLKKLGQAMEEAGISEELLAERLREGIDAEQNVYHAGRRIAREVDFSTRRKYCELALKVRGDLERDAEDQGESWEMTIFRLRAQRGSTEGSSA